VLTAPPALRGRSVRWVEHASIAWALKSGFYFADPYAAWQRGSNENANGWSGSTPFPACVAPWCRR